MRRLGFLIVALLLETPGLAGAVPPDPRLHQVLGEAMDLAAAHPASASLSLLYRRLKQLEPGSVRPFLERAWREIKREVEEAAGPEEYGRVTRGATGLFLGAVGEDPAWALSLFDQWPDPPPGSGPHARRAFQVLEQEFYGDYLRRHVSVDPQEVLALLQAHPAVAAEDVWVWLVGELAQRGRKRQAEQAVALALEQLRRLGRVNEVVLSQYRMLLVQVRRLLPELFPGTLESFLEQLQGMPPPTGRTWGLETSRGSVELDFLQYQWLQLILEGGAVRSAKVRALGNLVPGLQEAIASVGGWERLREGYRLKFRGPDGKPRARLTHLGEAASERMLRSVGRKLGREGEFESELKHWMKDPSRFWGLLTACSLLRQAQGELCRQIFERSRSLISRQGDPRIRGALLRAWLTHRVRFKGGLDLREVRYLRAELSRLPVGTPMGRFNRRVLVQRLAGQWARHDFKAAHAWALKLEGEALALEALLGIVSALAQGPPPTGRP